MNISTSIRRLTNLFIILFVMLSGWLVYWQVIAAQQVSSNVHNSRRCLIENSPLRGTIYDRNGQWLAKSVLDANAQCGYRRVYFDAALAGLIGYYAGPNYPATGVEKQFDDVLSGRTGITTLSNTVNQLLHRAPVGDDIYLTIDDRIQQIVDQRFSEQYYNGYNAGDQEYVYPSDAGTVIVSNPHTGEILAMLSRPSYDPNKLVQTLQQNDLSYYNQLVQDPEQPLLERPLGGNYVPGSTFKTVTLMAALDSGKTTLAQTFDRQHALGPVNYNGQNIGPSGNNIDGYTYHFPVTSEYGYTHSDNVIFAQLGVNTGFDTWMNYNRSFYIEGQIPFDLPVETSHVLPAGQSQMADNQLAADAFGQGTDFVTPLQMSLVNNIVANNGQLMRPTLIYKITEHKTSDQDNPASIQTFNPQSLATPIKSDTAVQVRQAMYGVMQCGPGTENHVNLSTSIWGIIGKTGTAQLSDVADTGQLAVGNRAEGWMLTEAPYTIQNTDQLPALTIVAMREHGGDGAASTGPMIGNIYNDVFSKGYVQTNRVSVPGLSYCYQTGLLQ
jgi:cell division protein FtsI/penicillin-binding protein 2